MDIRIIAPSDGKPDELWWADYWVKVDLQIEFLKQGHQIVDKNPDLDFYLFGDHAHSASLTAPRRFCWLYSHPDKIRENFTSQFEHVFVLSRTLLSQVNNSSLLLGASSKQFTPRQTDPQYDLIFVGNSHKPKRVEIIKHLIQLDRYKICLAGGAWPKALGPLIHKVDYKGPYIDNAQLGQFYNQGLLSFYSAHGDMRRHGFVAVRILDIFRSSENLCISDDNIGLRDIFRGIPTYTDKKHLAKQLDWFLHRPTARDHITQDCRQDADHFTFTRLVKEILKWI